MNFDRIKRIAIAAVFQGDRVLQSHRGQLLAVQHKTRSTDLVTQVDLAVEKAIIKTIQNQFPDHTILSEENGLSRNTSDICWIIDPIDGTTNFVHGLGNYSISIAAAHKDDILVGVVLNPVTGELFSAVKNSGARLNHQPISVSNTDDIQQSLLVTGFPYDRVDYIDALLIRLKQCLSAAQDVRRLGSAALDLCYLACGRFDGYWEQNLKPWDVAAGWLIATEAGAKITDFNDNPFHLTKKELLGTNGRIHQQMVKQLALKDITE
jgi:myo-inositol-1(or 4)-monophosphatase